MLHWFKIDAACEYTGGLSRWTLNQAIRAGRLQAARIGRGRNVVLSDAAIDEWLQGGKQPRDQHEELSTAV
jgi:excisionase family DNA binding protein